ncbi:MAG: Mu-like prophage major head subunit gpT family protein [Pseudomonadota bacterium]
MEVTRQSLNSAFVGFNAAFQSGIGMAPDQWSTVATQVPSTTRTTEYGWLGQFPGMRKWAGDRVINNLQRHGYALENEPYEMTVAVDRDDFDDDNLGIYAPMFQEMGRGSAALPNELVFALLEAGFDTECYDGQYFFDTDHPVLDKDGNVISVSNTGGGSGTAWYLMDTSRALKPLIYQLRRRFDRLIRKDRETDDNVFDKKKYVYGADGRCQVGFGFWQMAYGSKQELNATNYQAARAMLMGQKGDYQRPLGLMPRTLVVPPSLEGAARKIVVNTLAAGGETNEWAGTADVVVVPWL